MVGDLVFSVKIPESSNSNKKGVGRQTQMASKVVSLSLRLWLFRGPKFTANFSFSSLTSLA